MIGWTAKRLLTALPLLSPFLASVSITSYKPAPVLAMRLRKDDVVSVNPSGFVCEALKHRGYVDPISEVPIEQLGIAFEGTPASGEVRALCSRVLLRDGTVAQLPLLDFRCAVSPANQEAIALAMKSMGQHRGALLESGRSYHFYGYDPLEPGEWVRFMSRAILLAPLIDVRYLAHCLIEGLACLRVDTHSTHPAEPVVVRLMA